MADQETDEPKKKGGLVKIIGSGSWWPLAGRRRFRRWLFYVWR